MRERLASLANVKLSQLQPLKISRYMEGQRFDHHTDAIRGPAPEPDDWWGDRSRAEWGIPGAPIGGVNRVVTIFVYLNTVTTGGRTRWRWINYDEPMGGTHGRDFYELPTPGSGVTDTQGGSGTEFALQPEEGLAVIHFPATTASMGGVTDYNACHVCAEHMSAAA